MRNSDSSLITGRIIKLLILTLFLTGPMSAFSQRSEIGINLGAANYKGDLNPFPRIQNTRPAGAAFYRLNFNKEVSLKAIAGLSGIAGDDKYEKNEFHQQRNMRFSRTVLDLAAHIEYNFFDFIDDHSYRNWSPYFLIGMGASYNFGKISPGKKIQPFIPIGIGLKYSINKKFNLGIELVSKKTFTDYLDNVSISPDGTQFSEGNRYNKDWYYYIGFSFSYTFYKIHCPFRYE